MVVMQQLESPGISPNLCYFAHRTQVAVTRHMALEHHVPLTIIDMVRYRGAWHPKSILLLLPG